MAVLNFMVPIILACSVSSNPISDEGPTSICNVTLTPQINNELSTILSVTSSIQNANPIASLSIQELADQLYNSVVVADYETAVTKSLQLQKDGKSQAITDTVKKLLNDSKRNVVDFAYKLWNMFGKDIVKDYFPIQFRIIFNEDTVGVFNKRDDYPLNVVVSADKDGNRLAYGDGKERNSERLKWTMKSIWEGNRVYFKILNTLRNQYLKLSIAANTNAEHTGYTADAFDTHRQQWFLHPVVYNGDVLFYITNREYKQGLKLNTAVDNSGNRQLCSHNGDYVGNPERLGWHIKHLN